MGFLGLNPLLYRWNNTPRIIFFPSRTCAPAAWAFSTQNISVRRAKWHIRIHAHLAQIPQCPVHLLLRSQSYSNCLLFLLKLKNKNLWILKLQRCNIKSKLVIYSLIDGSEVATSHVGIAEIMNEWTMNIITVFNRLFVPLWILFLFCKRKRFTFLCFVWLPWRFD